MKKTMKIILIMMMIMAIVESKRIPRRRRQRNKEIVSMAAPKEYAAWHTYNKRFLAHISTPPSALHPEELKTHLSTLLRDLHFLPVVNAYLDTHLGQVNTESQAHTILTLLDLYSAQEPHRQRYLQQLRQRFVEAFDSYPDLMKPTVSTQFFLDGYDRHLKQMKRDTHALYERVLVPAPDNLDLVSYYDPGRLPSLDLALTRHGLPSPLLVLDKEQWYQLRQANDPFLSLSLHLSTWELTLANHSLQHAHFRFKEVDKPLTMSYRVQSAMLPDTTQLSYPCRHHSLCFDYQRAAEVKVVGLTNGEVALIHKHGSKAYFLHGAGRFADVQPKLHHRYPGPSAHWVLIPQP